MNFNEDSEAEFAVEPGRPYVFSASGDFGSGHIGLQWNDLEEWTAFPDCEFTEDASRVITAPTSKVRIVVAGTSGASLSAHLIPMVTALGASGSVRLLDVADSAARLALTATEVRTGDLVRESGGGVYEVLSTARLGSHEGFVNLAPVVLFRADSSATLAPLSTQVELAWDSSHVTTDLFGGFDGATRYLIPRTAVYQVDMAAYFCDENSPNGPFRQVFIDGVFQPLVRLLVYDAEGNQVAVLAPPNDQVFYYDTATGGGAYPKAGGTITARLEAGQRIAVGCHQDKGINADLYAGGACDDGDGSLALGTYFQVTLM